MENKTPFWIEKLIDISKSNFVKQEKGFLEKNLEKIN